MAGREKQSWKTRARRERKGRPATLGFLGGQCGTNGGFQAEVGRQRLGVLEASLWLQCRGKVGGDQAGWSTDERVVQGPGESPDQARSLAETVALRKERSRQHLVTGWMAAAQARGWLPGLWLG